MSFILNALNNLNASKLYYHFVGKLLQIFSFIFLRLKIKETFISSMMTVHDWEIIVVTKIK